MVTITSLGIFIVFRFAAYASISQFFLTDEKEYRSVILWLEDQKIRHYKIEERDGLRNIEKDSWKEAFDTYQRDLVSPAAGGTPNEQLNWILSYAVRLEYADNGMYASIKVTYYKKYYTSQ